MDYYIDIKNREIRYQINEHNQLYNLTNHPGSNNALRKLWKLLLRRLQKLSQSIAKSRQSQGHKLRKRDSE